jgi:hypothetical protein
MEPMTKKEKFKKFVSDHREVITKVTVYTTLVVGSIAIVAKALSDIEDIKQKNAERLDDHNSWVEQENAWLDEKEAEGKDIYLLHDWTYLLVPKDTETEWVKDREPRKHP